MKRLNVSLLSQTDTELAAVLLHQHLNAMKATSVALRPQQVIHAINRTIAKLEGHFALLFCAQ